MREPDAVVASSEAVLQHASSRGHRFEFLDGLRGIAAAAVVLQHGGGAIWPAVDRFGIEWFDFGRFGVAVFFLVSGFVIPHSLEREDSLGRFWVGRLLRLYPAYWVAILLFVLVSIGHPQFFPPDYQAHELRNTLVNLTMLQQYVGVPNASGNLWTLTIELGFYAVCSVLFALGLLARSLTIAWVGVLGFALTCVAAPLVFDRRIPYAIAFYAATLLVGTTLYRLAVGALRLRQVAALIVVLLALASAATWISYEHFRVAEGLQFDVPGALLPWLAGYAVFLGAMAAASMRVPRWLLGLGLISYSVYLLHPAAMALVDDWRPRWWAMVAVVVLTVATSTVVYFLVEQPAIRLGQRLRASMRARAPTTSR